MRFNDFGNKTVSQISAAAYENSCDRRREWRERVILENEAVELSNLSERLKGINSPLVEPYTEAAEDAAEENNSRLDEKYEIQRQLNDQKGHILAETQKQRINARRTQVNIGKLKRKTKLTETQSLNALNDSAKRLAQQMEQIQEALLRYDNYPGTVAKQREHTRHVVNKNIAVTEQVENALGNRMIRMTQGIGSVRGDRQMKEIAEGELLIEKSHGHLVKFYANPMSIAMPLSEESYLGDRGVMNAYLSLVNIVPEIKLNLQKGRHIEDILNDYEIKEKIRDDCEKYPVCVIKTHDEQYITVDIHNQRRVAAARLFGLGSIAVHVIAKAEKRRESV